MVAIVVLGLLFIIKTLQPSLGRFFLVFGISELLICVLGYGVLLNQLERDWIKSFLRGVLCKHKSKRD